MEAEVDDVGQPSEPVRRRRAAGACKVRCDAALLGVPCTNCSAFDIVCQLPASRWEKRNQQNVQCGRSRLESPALARLAVIPQTPKSTLRGTERTLAPIIQPISEDPSTVPSSANVGNPYLDFFNKPKFERAPLYEAGRVSFLGESSGVGLITHDTGSTTRAAIHYPIPYSVVELRPGLDEIDIDILHQRGAFLLPNQSLCDVLVESYFKWIHPIIPVINKTRFMRQYRDRRQPPSILLLQSVLLASTHVCKDKNIHGGEDSTRAMASSIYKRAKALYDAHYEEDRVVVVQSMILIGWYWGGLLDVTDSSFDWTRVAIAIAQGSGMHRSIDYSQLDVSDKRVWKRIWWTLFTRDKVLACTLGRPMHINQRDCDVEMLSEDDFIEDDSGRPSQTTSDLVPVQFFLRYVKLCEIIGTILSQEYTVRARKATIRASTLPSSDAALASWVEDCPESLRPGSPDRDRFWSAILHVKYQTTVCLLHRAYLLPTKARRDHSILRSDSLDTVLQAASVIETTVQELARENELRYCPSFIVYSLFSALTFRLLQLSSFPPSFRRFAHDRLRDGMYALGEVSRIWPVGQFVSALITAFIGDGERQKILRVVENIDKRISGTTTAEPVREIPDLDENASHSAGHEKAETESGMLQRRFDDQPVEAASGAKDRGGFVQPSETPSGQDGFGSYGEGLGISEHQPVILSSAEVDDWLQFFQFDQPEEVSDPQNQ